MIGLWVAVRPLVDSIPLSVLLAILCFGAAVWLVVLRPRKKDAPAPQTRSSVSAPCNPPTELPPKGPFVVGRLYRAKKTVAGPYSSFREGQLLRYLCWGFVPYDEMTCFNFSDEEGKRVYWSVYDKDPIDQWEELFEEVKEMPSRATEPA